MDRNLAQRIGFSAVAIPLALLLVWLGGWPLAAALALVAVLGVRELFALAERQGVRPAGGLGLVTAAVVPVLAYGAVSGVDAAEAAASEWVFVLAIWTLVLLTWALARRPPDARPLHAVATTFFGVAYAAGLPSFLIGIRHGDHGIRSLSGAALVVYPLVVTWVCDTAAMFGGRAWGGAKLAPRISPGKTRAGGIAGVVGALVVAPIFGAAVFPPLGVPLGIAQLLLLAGVLGVVGQAGDLAESLFKREAGVKDSGTLLPGHGGILDRLDSLYFVLPVAAAFYRAWRVI